MSVIGKYAIPEQLKNIFLSTLKKLFTQKKYSTQKRVVRVKKITQCDFRHCFPDEV